MRLCKTCKIEKPLTKEYFPTTKGIFTSHHCTKCKVAKDKAKRHKNMSNPEYALKKNSRIRDRYHFDKPFRAGQILKAYRQADEQRHREFDLNKKWFVENILNKSCFYCETNEQIGADRIDNTKGHTKDNCVPCCSVCNSVKLDIFNNEEMKAIGLLIKELRLKRDIRKISKRKMRDYSLVKIE